jgi:hypothetical protein
MNYINEYMANRLHEWDCVACSKDEKMEIEDILNHYDMFPRLATDYRDAEFPYIVYCMGRVYGYRGTPEANPDKNWMSIEEFAFKALGEDYIIGISLEEIKERLEL